MPQIDISNAEEIGTPAVASIETEFSLADVVVVGDETDLIHVELRLDPRALNPEWEAIGIVPKVTAVHFVAVIRVCTKTHRRIEEELSVVVQAQDEIAAHRLLP